MVICTVDGVELRVARSGKWVHVNELPEKTPEHEAKPAVAATIERDVIALERLRNAAGEMLRHHSQIHPVSECEWYLALLKAWKNT